MATLLADPPAPPDGSQAEPDGATAAPAAARPCSSCGAPMSEGQDWCFYCGAGARGSLMSHAHQWRPAAAVLAAVALLVVAAASAGYAALTKSSSHRRPASLALARTPVLPAGSAGAAGSLPLGSSKTRPPVIPKLGNLVKPLRPLVKTPAAPLVGAGAKTTPAVPATTPPATNSTPAPTKPAASTKTSTGTATTPAPEAQPQVIVLDTDAASTYDPYGYPASNFGDPSLAIDGEAGTAWTALVEPAVAPNMAEGLLINLESPQRLSALELITSTPGMTVQVYGSAAATAPASITDPAWVRLSAQLVAKQHSTRIALADSKQAYRFVVLWISKAPASAVGTPERPGHVSVNEIELFPAS